MLCVAQAGKNLVIQLELIEVMTRVNGRPREEALTFLVWTLHQPPSSLDSILAPVVLHESHYSLLRAVLGVDNVIAL
jgi:hypothetical protein